MDHRALLVSLLLAVACTDAQARAPQEFAPALQLPGGDLHVPENSPLRGRLTIAKASTQTVRHELDVPAAAEADPAALARISPPLAGRVVKLFVRLGIAVREGDPLFLLDSADLVAAQSDYLKARSAMAQADRNFARQRDLSAHGVGAQKELEQAQTDAELVKSELSRTVTRLRLLGMGPGEVGRPLTVRAPLSGRVIELSTAPGQYQNDPAAVLMTIADLSSLWVTASVPEKDVQRVFVGQQARVEFSAWPGQRFEGKVQLVGDVLAPETRTVKVRIRLANPEGRLKPGMFARVTLSGPESPELLVPAAALQLRGERSYLFVEKSPWTFERRAVEVGETLPQGVCISGGLSPGERIVASNSILMP